MPLGGVNVGWSESTPSGTSQAGLGDDDLKSIKTSVRNGLDSEHHWSSTGGAGTGAHRKGSAVIFYGAASAVSSSDTEGRLMLTSDTSVLFHVASAMTIPLGGRYALHSVSAYTNTTNATNTSGTTQRWLSEVGYLSLLSTSASTSLTFRTTFVGVPVVTVSRAGAPASLTALPIIQSIGATSLVLVNYNPTSGASGAPSLDYLVSYHAQGIVSL